MLHQFVVIGNHGFHSRPLKHYFGDLYLDHPGPLLCCLELSSIPVQNSYARWPLTFELSVLGKHTANAL